MWHKKNILKKEYKKHSYEDFVKIRNFAVTAKNRRSTSHIWHPAQSRFVHVPIQDLCYITLFKVLVDIYVEYPQISTRKSRNPSPQIIISKLTKPLKTFSC